MEDITLKRGVASNKKQKQIGMKITKKIGKHS